MMMYRLFSLFIVMTFSLALSAVRSKSACTAFVCTTALDGFFDYQTGDDDELDSYFIHLYDALASQDYDEDKSLDTLRNFSDDLGHYLRKRKELSSLELYINDFVVRHKSPIPKSDDDIEILVADFLATVEKADESLNYLTPILAKYEHYILLLASHETAKDKAISFFIQYILNGFLTEHHHESFAIRTGRLVSKMVHRRDTVVDHKAFLANKKPIANRAYGSFFRLKLRFLKKPNLNALFRSSLEKRIESKQKEKQIKHWLDERFPLKKKQRNLIYDLALQILCEERYHYVISKQKIKS